MNHPVSLAAERAVRILRRSGTPKASVELAMEVLATQASDETSATRVLRAAFAGDHRLVYEQGSWRLHDLPRTEIEQTVSTIEDPDRVLVFVEGAPRVRGRPFELKSISALRLHADDVVAACGGDISDGPSGNRLRRAILETLEGAVPVIHDPPGSLQAIEAWLGEPLTAPVSMRRIAQQRLELPARHDFEQLVGRLGLSWRQTDDPLEQADALDACLRALRRPEESLHDLRALPRRGVTPIDWSRYAFNRNFLRNLPRVPGTYRFFDDQDELIYVGKSKNLRVRLASYFREDVTRRSGRVQQLLDRLYRIEYDAAGSDLEAMLREAEQIRRDNPSNNVQRRINPSRARASRLHSILILEPAEPPNVLRAYLIRDGRLIDRVRIGPRGGGLKRIERLLDDYFFFSPAGPTSVEGPDLDVEIVARWLAGNRDRVVAFDPTDLKSSGEVVERLRWFLGQGSPFDADGSPVFRH